MYVKIKKYLFRLSGLFRVGIILLVSLYMPTSYVSAKVPRGFIRKYEDALKISREKKQVLMIDFYTKECFPSKQIEQEVYRSKQFFPLADSMVCVKVNGETPAGKILTEKYHITGYPTVLFVDPEGKELERITSQVPLNYFLATVRRILAGNAISQLEGRFPKRVGYSELYLLSLYYVRNVFDKKKLDHYFSAFRKMDPGYKKDSTQVLTRYVLQKELRAGVYSAAGEIESFVFDVPQGNSYKLAVLLTKYYLNIKDTQRAWDFFSGYYMFRENKAPIEGFYQELQTKLGKNH